MFSRLYTRRPPDTRDRIREISSGAGAPAFQRLRLTASPRKSFPIRLLSRLSYANVAVFRFHRYALPMHVAGSLEGTHDLGLYVFPRTGLEKSFFRQIDRAAK